MFMDWRTQYQDTHSAQIGVQIQCNVSQKPSKLSCRNCQTHSKTYTEKKTYKSRNNVEAAQS